MASTVSRIRNPLDQDVDLADLLGQVGDRGRVTQVGGDESRLPAEYLYLFYDLRASTGVTAVHDHGGTVLGELERATALPMPEVPPVTNAVCPISSEVVDAVLVFMRWASIDLVRQSCLTKSTLDQPV
jgi:hypothetical protein